MSPGQICEAAARLKTLCDCKTPKISHYSDRSVMFYVTQVSWTVTASCDTSSGQKIKVWLSSHGRAESEGSGNDNYHQPTITHHPCPSAHFYRSSSSGRHHKWRRSNKVIEIVKLRMLQRVSKGRCTKSRLFDSGKISSSSLPLEQ